MTGDIPSPSSPTQASGDAAKRVFDLIASSLGLLALLPAFLAIALAIRLDSPGPVFFRQERVGRQGRLFKIFKFRTMREDKTGGGLALTVKSDKRITHVGDFLRRHKLDELPQLLNVFTGEMSLVGPRPEVPEFMKYYSPEQRAVLLSVAPGMTDYAAILFRDENSLLDGSSDPVTVYRQEIMPKKFFYYSKYVADHSVLIDLRIILATIFVLLFKRTLLAMPFES
jgi:lipopolysaccharide/colanic/teichoic acid biosynthesis glycosyltransferase